MFAPHLLENEAGTYSAPGNNNTWTNTPYKPQYFQWEVMGVYSDRPDSSYPEFHQSLSIKLKTLRVASFNTFG